MPIAIANALKASSSATAAGVELERNPTTLPMPNRGLEGRRQIRDDVGQLLEEGAGQACALAEGSALKRLVGPRHAPVTLSYAEAMLSWPAA